MMFYCSDIASSVMLFPTLSLPVLYHLAIYIGKRVMLQLDSENIFSSL